MKKTINDSGSSDKRVRWKNFIRRYPRLAAIFEFIFNPAFISNRARNKLLGSMPKSARILNIGSGVKKFGRMCINLDIEPFVNVDIIANAQDLPFPEGSFDLVLLEYVIEHVSDNRKMICEIKRVLKNEGVIYSAVPFIQSYHGNPKDYHRYTIDGFAKLWESAGFHTRDCRPLGGPTSALACILKEYLAILLSFNSRTLYSILSQLFIIPFFLLKYLDLFLMNNRNAHNISYAFYYIGEKPSRDKNE